MIIFILLPFWDYYFHIITLMGALLGPGPGPWALLGQARTMGPIYSSQEAYASSGPKMLAAPAAAQPPPVPAWGGCDTGGRRRGGTCGGCAAAGAASIFGPEEAYAS